MLYHDPQNARDLIQSQDELQRGATPESVAALLKKENSELAPGAGKRETGPGGEISQPEETRGSAEEKTAVPAEEIPVPEEEPAPAPDVELPAGGGTPLTAVADEEEQPPEPVSPLSVVSLPDTTDAAGEEGEDTVPAPLLPAPVPQPISSADSDAKSSFPRPGGHPDPDSFTTAGFEFEFIQLQRNTLLDNVVHAPLSQSTPFVYTGLPFSLETDSSGTLELVTPPFIVDTLPNTTIPSSEDIAHIAELMESALSALAAEGGTIDVLFNNLKRDLGLDFSKGGISIEWLHMLGEMSPTLKQIKGNRPAGQDLFPIKLDYAKFKDLPLGKSTKTPDREVATQVNIAVDADTYRQLLGQLPAPDTQPGAWKERREALEEAENQMFQQMEQEYAKGMDMSEEERFFIREIAHNLIQLFAVDASKKYQENARKYFRGQTMPPSHSGEHPESHVKDMRGLWFKDSIKSLALGMVGGPVNFTQLGIILPDLIGTLKEYIPEEETSLRKYIEIAVQDLSDFLRNLEPQMAFDGTSGVDNYDRRELCDTEFEEKAQEEMPHHDGKPAGRRNPKKTKPTGKKSRVSLQPASQPAKPRGVKKVHEDRIALLGARQDTFIPNAGLKVAPSLDGRRLHVVESRYTSTREIVKALQVLESNQSGRPEAVEPVPENPPLANARAKTAKGRSSKRGKKGRDMKKE